MKQFKSFSTGSQRRYVRCRHLWFNLQGPWGSLDHSFNVNQSPTSRAPAAMSAMAAVSTARNTGAAACCTAGGVGAAYELDVRSAHACGPRHLLLGVPVRHSSFQGRNFSRPCRCFVSKPPRDF